MERQSKTEISSKNQNIYKIKRVFDFLDIDSLNLFADSRSSTIKLAFFHSSSHRENDDYCEYVNFFTKSHMKNKCPAKALFYFPTPSERIVIYQNKMEKNLRRIFEGAQDYIPFEENGIKKMEEMMELHNKQNKTDYNITDPTKWLRADTLRLLQATAFNYSKSLEYITNNIDWKKESYPIKLSQGGKNAIKMGFIYAHGRDNRYRPIVIIDATVYMNNKEKIPYEDWLNAIIFFMNYMVNGPNVLIPGQVENWNVICDMQEISITSIPSDFRRFLKVMSSNFRCRLYVSFILNMSWIVRGVWALVKTFLDPVTQDKVRIFGSSDREQIFEFINPCQVEVKLGGKAKNMEENFFPPKLVDGPIEVSKGDHEIYVDEQTYLKKISCSAYRIHPRFSSTGKHLVINRTTEEKVSLIQRTIRESEIAFEMSSKAKAIKSFAKNICFEHEFDDHDRPGSMGTVSKTNKKLKPTKEKFQIAVDLPFLNIKSYSP